MAQRSERYAEQILETVSQRIVVLTGDLEVETVNDAFCRAFKVTAEKSQDASSTTSATASGHIPELRRLLHDVLSEENAVRDYRVEPAFEEIGERIKLLHARRMAREAPATGSCSRSTTSPKGERERQRHELEGLTRGCPRPLTTLAPVLRAAVLISVGSRGSSPACRLSRRQPAKAERLGASTLS